MKKYLAWTLLCCVCGVANAADLRAPGISDHIQFGDPAVEAAHALRITGTAEPVRMHTQLGVVEHERMTRELRGRGTSVTFEMSVPLAESAPRILLEIQEMHDRRPDVFGYTVSAGGEEVYFRTYEEVGAGPNHYFIEIPRERIGADDRLTVEVRSESDAPFNLSQAWVYPDFGALAERENVFSKLRFNLGLSAEVAGIKPPPENKRDLDFRIQVARKLNDLYGNRRDYDFGLFYSLLYSRRSRGECREAVDSALAISEATGLPATIMFLTWWGSENVGPDGVGGYFSDLKYHSIAYNAKTGKFRPSFPSQWGNTLWPTKNNDHLNRCNNYNLGIHARYLADRLAAVRASGASVPTPRIVAEMGPNVVDFNQATLEDARRDGVDLDPTDGLTHEEGRWILKNYGAYFAQQAPTYRRALGHGDVIVQDGAADHPANPMNDNIFTHGYWGAGAPPHDPKYAYWQANLNEGMWNSGELTEAYPQSWYEYALANGRLACVNLERVMIQDLRYMKFAYANGLEFVTLYNAKAGDHELLQEVDGIADEEFAAIGYERRVLDVNMRRDRSLADNPAYVSSTGIMSTEKGISPEKSGAAGRVVFRIRDNETAFENGLTLRISGGAGRPAGRANKHMRVLTGPAPDQLAQAVEFGPRDFKGGHGWGAGQFATADLSETARGKTDIFVGVELYSGDRPQDVVASEISAFVPWDRDSGQLDGTAPTRREARTRNLWLQQRVRTERLLREYAAKADGRDDTLQNVRKLNDSGYYAEAYTVLASALSETLPARYSIRGAGKLGIHPVVISTETEKQVVQVELLKFDRDGVEFRLQAPVETPCVVKIADLETDALCVMENTGPNQYAVKRVKDFGDKTLKATDGMITLTLTAGPLPEAPPFPFEPVEKVQLERTSRGRYETETGIIKSLEPPSVVNGYCNGIIELDSGNRYELGYLPWWTKANMVGLEGLKSVSLEKIAQAFQPGSKVEIQYEPWAYKGFPPRILSVSQPVKLLLNEDYVQNPEGWEQRAVEVDGLHVADYRGHKLYPRENLVPGHVVYRVVSDEPLRQTAVGFTGRLILRPGNRVTFYVRTAKNNEWRKCGEYTTASPGSNSWPSLKIVNITDFVKGETAFDLKVEMVTVDTTWCSIGSLQVRTEGWEKAEGP
jgi:hypothetical protein